MLTHISIHNFKRFGKIEIELGNPVVFVGPNNSGKTSALQALALWDIGLKRWNEKRSGKKTPEKRPGVTINRNDLVSIPVPVANLLWRQLHVRNVRQDGGSQRTDNVRIDIVVKGVTNGNSWRCGLEFDYANDESFYCRPLRLSEGKASPERMKIPDEAGKVEVAFLPPMSGLAATETLLVPGAVNVRIGEGRTAEVLRNLCYRIHEERREDWEKLVDQIANLFGVELKAPSYIEERGEIIMTYREEKVELDLSSAGRGLQQTLLLLAYMYANPGAVLLLDEPDAHLEILRQRQIYHRLTHVAHESGNQIIAASHSEVLLNEAADRDMVIAFVGPQPHRIDDRGSQLRKSLRDISFDQYYQAEQTGWVLYIEGSTDFSILKAFARRLGHEEAIRILERPFVHYVGNQSPKASDHFHGLREAFPRLQGVALFDRLESGERGLGPVECLMWRRKEIENYFCSRATLDAYVTAAAHAAAPGPLFSPAEVKKRQSAMRTEIDKMASALELIGRGSPWDADTDMKVSDEFLKPLFENYFQRLELPNLMTKKKFYELADHVPEGEIDPEVSEKLDAIVAVAKKATPV